MKFHYYPETDSLYIELSEKAGAEALEISAGVVADYDADGHIVGLDIDNASTIVNLTKLEAESLPIARVAFG